MSRIVEPIRSAVARAPSQYVVGKGAGVDKATLSRFVAGLITPRGDILDRLAAYFDMRISTANGQGPAATKAGRPGREPRKAPAAAGAGRGVHRAKRAKRPKKTKIR